VGSGSLANFMCLGLPINSLDKVFLSHLHADHTADLITLFGSFRKAGRKGPLQVWGGNGSEPKYGSQAAIDAIAAACAWDTESTRGFTSNEAAEMRGTEFDASVTSVVYKANGVTITAFPVIHNLHGAVGYRVDFAGLSMVFSGDTQPCWPLVRAAEGTDLLIHECFPSADALAALTGDRVERFETITATHTVPKTAGRVFDLVRPRMAGLWHTLLVPPVVAPILEQVGTVFDGPVVQTQDLTVFNITKDAVVARQAEAVPQPMAVPGEPKFEPTYGQRPTPPSWWKDALIADDLPEPHPAGMRSGGPRSTPRAAGRSRQVSGHDVPNGQPHRRQLLDDAVVQLGSVGLGWNPAGGAAAVVTFRDEGHDVPPTFWEISTTAHRAPTTTFSGRSATRTGAQRLRLQNAMDRSRRRRAGRADPAQPGRRHQATSDRAQGRRIPVSPSGGGAARGHPWRSPRSSRPPRSLDAVADVGRSGAGRAEDGEVPPNRAASRPRCRDAAGAPQASGRGATRRGQPGAVQRARVHLRDRHAAGAPQCSA
jgi:ribonuclease Z